MIDRWDRYFMDIALRSAQMSYCTRLKVGATAVIDRRPILSSWNGTPCGYDNSCEEWIEDGDYGSGWFTKAEVSHAEENLISWAAKKGTSLEGSTLYVTHAPCVHCAKLIKNAGIARVIWNETYRLAEGLEYLDKYGVLQQQLAR